MAGYSISYNGVLFKERFTECKEHRLSVVMSEDGGQALYIHHRFSIQTFIAADSVLMGVGQYWNSIKGRLMTTRGPLVISANAVQMLNLVGGDAKAGPVCSDFSITKFVGDRSAWLNFTIECDVPACDSNIAGVISNRWSSSANVDENHIWTRKVQGKLIVRDRSFQPDSFRELCIPPRPKGFKRISGDFQVSSDGLMLTYEIVDKQRYRPVPVPIANWTGTFELSTQNGTLSNKSMHAKAWADNSRPKSDLMTFLGNLILARFNFDQSAQRDIIKGASFRESLDENWMEVNISAQSGATDSFGKFAGIVKSAIGADIEVTDNKDENDFGARGTYYVTLFVSESMNACDAFQQTVGAVGEQFGSQVDEEDDEDDNTPPQTTIGTTAMMSIEDDATSYNDAHLANPYTICVIESKYIFDENKLQLPYASTATDDCVVVKVGKPFGRRICRCTATRNNLQPQVPSWVTGDPNEILLDRQIITETSPVSPDGHTKVHSITTEYVYALKKIPTQELKSGKLPYLKDSEVQTLSLYEFQDNSL